MKFTLTFLLFSCISISLLAQNRAVKNDTINLKGTIYGSDGKPLSNITVLSSQTDPRYTKSRIKAISDDNGEFALTGIIPNDTLTILSINYDILKFYNKGSRVMAIILPTEKIEDINSQTPVEVTAKRIIPKIIPDIKVAVTNDNPPSIILQNAEFPGGPEKFIAFLKRNLIYPEKAIKNSIEGTVEVKFTVEKDGSLTDFMVLKGIGYGCDEELISTIKKVPRWRQAFMNGNFIATKTSVSVKFSLTE